MACSQTEWLGNKEYLQRFRRKIIEQRVPLSGSIDLTHRCNFRCVHCYLGDQESIATKRNRELSTEQWLGIVDQITDAGCLYLLITGGDPLISNNFSIIYKYAKLKGLLVTVFTNGTLLSEEIVGLFKELPPHAVEISLYGASEETYEKITGIKGAYARCISGIERLLAAGIRVNLKTILMTLNRHEFEEIKNTAKKYGVPFRFDAMIFPKFNGDKSPLHLRVSPQEVVEKELLVAGRKKLWLQVINRSRTSGAATDLLYTCGTGLSSFHINTYGMLQSCIMVTNVRYDLLQGDFTKGWQDIIPLVRKKKITNKKYRCGQCNKINICGICPAFSVLETNSEEIASEYICSLGAERFKQINL